MKKIIFLAGLIFLAGNICFADSKWGVINRRRRVRRSGNLFPNLRLFRGSCARKMDGKFGL